MKILFLDMDGVLTVPPSYLIQDNLVNNLRRVIQETGTKIVLSSSWKEGKNISDTKKHLSDTVPEWLISNLYDQTDILFKPRGDEIKKWLTEHESEVSEYVILDDVDDILPEQYYHFVQTNFEFGFCGDRVELCIKLLNGDYIQNEFALNIPLIIAWRMGKIGDLEIERERFKETHPYRKNP